jgi:chloride channel protein, CIC family
LLGVVSIWFPQLLGNGRDISQLAFTNQVAPALLLILLVLKPAATVLCIRSGAPGGLFTPSLTVGALLGALLGHAWSWFWPGVPPGLFAVLGAAETDHLSCPCCSLSLPLRSWRGSSNLARSMTLV